MSTLTEIVEVREAAADDLEIEERSETGGGASSTEHAPRQQAWSSISTISSISMTSTVEVAVAVGKGSSSLRAVQWALENHLVQPGGLLHLIHIQTPLRYIPSPMGNNIPLQSVSEDVANRYKLQRFLETEQLLYEYKKMCDDRQVNSEVFCAEGDVVHKMILDQISSLCVAKLVLGTSSQSRITKALKKQSIASMVAKNAPGFCTVLVVCKGKLLSMKEAAKAT